MRINRAGFIPTITSRFTGTVSYHHQSRNRFESRARYQSRRRQPVASLSTEPLSKPENVFEKLEKSDVVNAGVNGNDVEEMALDDDPMFAKNVTFSGMGLSEVLLEKLEMLGVKRPTGIQALSIPYLVERLAYQITTDDEDDKGVEDVEKEEGGGVVMFGAETGSGKTLGYVLPWMECVIRGGKDVKLMVVVPSRELCSQVARVVRSLGVDCVALKGGSLPEVGIGRREVRCVVGTPRMLTQYWRFGDGVRDKMIVIDEADMLLDGGFKADVERLLDCPQMKPFAHRKNFEDRVRNKNRLVFVGATYPQWQGERVKSSVNWIRKRYPGAIEMQTSDIHKKSHRVAESWQFLPTHEQRFEALKKLLLHESDLDEKIIVFGGKAATVNDVCNRLRQSDRSELEARYGGVAECHKLVEGGQRDEEVEKFRNGQVRLLFCTDLASRGLDLGAITRVVEFEFATNVVAYLHRIGRTARAGNTSGICHANHFYDEVSRPLAEAIKQRAEKGQPVVEGVFSRRRGFRRKLKKVQRMERELLALPEDQTEQSLTAVD